MRQIALKCSLFTCLIFGLLFTVACTPTEASAPPTATDSPSPMPTATRFISATLPPTWTLTYTPSPDVTNTPSITPSPTFTKTPTVTPTPTYMPVRVSLREAATIYNGPGTTYLDVGQLGEGAEIAVLERNLVGNWVRIARAGVLRDRQHQRWIMTGKLEFGEDLLFSDTPVNTLLLDANLETVEDEALRQLYALPIIPEIAPEMLEVYERGQRLGNYSEVITKVGDSLTADGLYLSNINEEQYLLGPYDYLDETIRFFQGSVAPVSVAAQKGLNTFSVFSTFMASNTICQPEETPLQCEYNRRQPSISFIMFGPNDVLGFSVEEYDQQMRLIVEETLNHDVIPVLSTFSYHPDNAQWSRAVSYNLAIVQIADDYNVPLMNLWSATRDLPNYGLDADDVHMRRSGVRIIDFSRGYEAKFGGTLRNLIAIHMLHELRLTLEME